MISLHAIINGRRGGEGEPDLSLITCANDIFSGNSVDWHSNDNFIACGRSTGHSSELSVWSFDGTTLSKVESVGFGTSVWSVAWHPDGNFLAAGSGSSIHAGYLKVYSWNGSDTLTEVESIGITYKYYYRKIDWHPDGNFLATVKYSASTDNRTIQVYSWDGISTLSLVVSGSITGEILVKWSPDGNYLAVGGYSSGGSIAIVRVYSWNGSALSLVATYSQGSISINGARGITWSKDSSELFVGFYTASTTALDLIVALSFDGSSLIKLYGIYNLASPGASTAIIPELSVLNGYLFTSVTGYTSGVYPILGAYSWHDSVLTEKNSLSTSNANKTMAISHSNKYLAITKLGAPTFCIYSTGLHL